MKKLIFFKNCNSIFEVKKHYKCLAFLHHPDKEGGDTKIMQEINGEYEFIIKNKIFPEDYEPTMEETEKNIIFPEIINALINFENITIELVGKWIWISGNTYPIKEDLKKLGFLFSGNKKLWYWRTDENKRSNMKPLDMDKIRNKYGSDTYSKQTKFMLN
jgi:hypothetical protein